MKRFYYQNNVLQSFLHVFKKQQVAVTTYTKYSFFRMISLNKIFNSLWLPILTLCVFTIIVYINGSTGPFLWDDLETVVNNSIIREWKNIPSLFTSSIFGQTAGANAFFRPFVALSLMINFKTAGLSPFWFHITNIFLHTGSVTILYFLINKLRYSRQIAFLVAAIFAVHPIGIEVVTYISGRSDALVSLFILLSIFAFVKSYGKDKWMIISVISFLSALLSKESAITVPLILIGIMWAWPEHLTRNKKRIAIALLAIAILYTVTRLIALSGASNGSLSWISEATFFERILTLPLILLTYIKIFFVPYPLHMEYHFVTKSLFDIGFLIGVPSIVALLMMILKEHDKSKKTVFWLFWFFIGIAPVLHIPVAQTSTVREHWIYLPAIGLIVLLLTAPIWEMFTKKLLVGLSIFFIFILSALTIDRNLDWLNSLKLYEHDAQKEPRSFVLWNNVGTAHYNLGNMGHAKEAFTNAILNSPNRKYSVAHNNLGVIMQREGELAVAEQLFSQSILLNNYELAYGNLAELYAAQGRIEDAKEIIMKGVAIHKYSERLKNIAKTINNE